jgi:hypothetical protein
MSSLPLGYHLATVLTAAAEEDRDYCDPALLCPHLSKAALLSPQRRLRSTSSSSSSKPKLSSRLQLSEFSSTINNNNNNNMPYIVNEASLSCFDLVDEDSLVWTNNVMDSTTSCDTTVASSCSGRTGTTTTTTTTTTSSSWNSFRGEEDDAHHVMFHAEPTIYMIPNRTDDFFSAEEIRLSWYQEADIARMKQEAAHHDNKQQQQQQRPWTLKDDYSTAKQNQSRSIPQQRRKRASWELDASRYLSALVGVLEEQERQRLCSDCRCGINEANGATTTTTTTTTTTNPAATSTRRKCVVWDTELLAQVYRFHSLPAAKKARIIARQHRDSSRE